MSSFSLHWHCYRGWISARYPGWLAHCGLTAALVLIFAIVSR